MSTPINRTDPLSRRVYALIFNGITRAALMPDADDSWMRLSERERFAEAVYAELAAGDIQFRLGGLALLAQVAGAPLPPIKDVMADDLATWLRAKWDAQEQELAEDERVALATPHPWPWSVDKDAIGHVWAEGLNLVVKDAYPENAEHIARWDPARVLREVAEERADIEAKRRILALHRPVSADEDACRDDGYPMPCPTVRLLASPYAGRDGYRQEWRPWR